MTTELAITAPGELALAGGFPAVVIENGKPATWRVIEFLTAAIGVAVRIAWTIPASFGPASAKTKRMAHQPKNANRETHLIRQTGDPILPFLYTPDLVVN